MARKSRSSKKPGMATKGQDGRGHSGKKQVGKRDIRDAGPGFYTDGPEREAFKARWLDAIAKRKRGGAVSLLGFLHVAAFVAATFAGCSLWR